MFIFTIAVVETESNSSPASAQTPVMSGTSENAQKQAEIKLIEAILKITMSRPDRSICIFDVLTFYVGLERCKHSLRVIVL